jgi:aryl-alcohol dehydrogenase-like predicted oxidoreductase
MIPKEPFGRTGQASSRIIFGGYALNKAKQDEADKILDLLPEYGVNHIDTAPMYGVAEKRIGSWLEGRRQDYFIATKTRSRTYEGAWKNLRRSLEHLRVEYIDLWQMHGLTNPVGWERAMGDGGTLQAFIEARDQGLVRFLGVTGHGVKTAAMHLQSLERFEFDTVMLPYNYMLMQNPRYAAEFEALVSLCRERNVAVQTIKSIARCKWGDGPKTFNTYYYEPLDAQEAIDKTLHWAMGYPGTFVITAGDMGLAPRMLQAVNSFELRPSDDEMAQLSEKYSLQAVFS